MQPYYKARQGGDHHDDRLVTTMPYQLFVSNIPQDLTEDGIRNIFARHGNVLRVDLSKNLDKT